MRPTNFQGNIHIINFPAGTSAADLAALFDDFGIVIGAQIKTIPSTGGTLRMGIVAVAPDKAADKAIEALQGYQLGGQKLKLRKAKPPEKAAPKPRAPRAPRPAPSNDRFPAQPYAEAPRKVIVEYKKSRTLTRV
jgi:RNA recognition motif-containing protein